VDKAKIRQRFKTVRESLTAKEVAAASQAICQELTCWELLQSARTVLAYVAFRNELDLSALFRLGHIRWAIPRVVGPQLVLHTYDPDRLVRHRFGMLEPAADLPVVSPGEVDLVLTPGVAFDRRGGRLGFGGGFYDRLLPATPALRVGVTYDRCLAEEVPIAEHDQRMDWIVTPTQQIHCAVSWRAG
jgi:5-formyltetrahydrofolate cyclo-ligase